MVSDSGSHRRGAAKGTMHATQVVEREPQTISGLEVVPFFAECTGTHVAQRRGVIFCEGFRTLKAAVTLKTVAVFSKLLAAGIAVVAGHEVLLDFSAEKPHNEGVTFMCGLSPALGFSPVLSVN